MSIEAGVGVPGSGKSFYAVQKALQYMASGGAVFSNIRLHGVEDKQEENEALRNALKISKRAYESFVTAEKAVKTAQERYDALTIFCSEDFTPSIEQMKAASDCLDAAQDKLSAASEHQERCAAALGKLQIERWKLGESSNVRRVLKKEYRWEYVDLNGGQYHYIDLDTMDDGFLQAIPRGSPSKRILLILDEVNEWFDSLDGGKLKSDAKYREMFKFLRLSRHYHIDVLFLLQDFSTLNARLRGLCSCMWKFTDMQKMRVAGVPFRFPFAWFLWQQYDKTGKHCLKSSTWPKEQAVFDCYDSFCEFGAVSLSGVAYNSDFSNLGKPAKKGTKKMTMLDRVILIACCLCVVFFSGGFGKGSKRGAAASAAVVTVTNTVSLVSSPVASGGAPAAVRPRVTVEYAYMSYHSDGSELNTWVFANGCMWRKGQRHEQGLVVDLGKDFVRLVGDDGYEHYIYHREMEPDRQQVFDPQRLNSGANAKFTF